MHTSVRPYMWHNHPEHATRTHAAATSMRVGPSNPSSLLPLHFPLCVCAPAARAVLSPPPVGVSPLSSQHHPVVGGLAQDTAQSKTCTGEEEVGFCTLTGYFPHLPMSWKGTAYSSLHVYTVEKARQITRLAPPAEKQQRSHLLAVFK